MLYWRPFSMSPVMVSRIPMDTRKLSLRQLLPWLLPGLALVVYYEISAWRAAGALGFPLDDAWIHAQFARNLANGEGFTYTGDRWVAGSTSPAWTLLLALGYLVTRSATLSAKLIGVLLHVGCGLLAARLVLVLTANRVLAAACAAVVLAVPAMVWGAVSGMEIGLSVAATLAGMYLYLSSASQSRREAAAFAMLSAACLARPETFVILAVTALHATWRGPTLHARLRTAAIAAIVAAAVIGPLIVFDYATTGRPLPTTFYAKSGPGLVRAVTDGDSPQLRKLVTVSGPDAVKQLGDTFFEQFGPFAWIVLAGFVTAFTGRLRSSGAPLIAAAIILTAYAMGLVAPQRLKPENFRYTAPLIALSAVLATAGLSGAWSVLSGRAVRAGVVALAIVVVSWQAAAAVSVYSVSVKNIQELHVALGKWLRTHIPAGGLVAVNDIGAIAFFSGHRIVDLEGLVSPEALAFPRAERGIGFTSATKPDYVAVFPSWHPDIASRPDLFQEVYRTSIPDNVVSAGDTIVVYRTPWTRYPLLTGDAAGQDRH